MISRLRRPGQLTAAVPLALVALLSGCSSDSAGAGSASASSSGDSDAPAQQLTTVKSVECPGKAKPVSLPDGGVPAPLPEGLIAVDVRGPVGGSTVVTGVVPRAEAQVLTELQGLYASAGLTLSQGETEARDAESNFAGKGVTGRWGIRELTDCSPVATRIDLVYTPVS